MVSAYYNENDPKAAAWLRELIKGGHIAPGEVDERSIEDVPTSDLDGYTQCHFFAGIGGWSLALRLAGVPDDYPVWTGSCPCTPHSRAAHGNNTAHDLWEQFAWRISAKLPRVLFSEQVANTSGWFDVVCDDLEALDYSIGAAVLPACSVGADHIRERLYFVGYSDKYSKPSFALNAEAPGVPWDFGHSGGMVSPDGLPARVAYSGFGNAIVPQVAEAFIRAALR